MPTDRTTRCYRAAYVALLRLFPRPFRDRFGEEMERTFTDLCRERSRLGQRPEGLVFWLFRETAIQVAWENLMSVRDIRKGVVLVFLTTGLILSIPLVAMRFSDEVRWSAFDFVAAGTLLLGAGLTGEFLMRKFRNSEYRLGSGVAVFTALFVTWVNLAVGIIGNEDNPANALYFLVLLLGATGSVLTDFRPLGMSRVMFATAAGMAVVPWVAALVWGLPVTDDLMKSILFSGFVALAYVISAKLFRSANRSLDRSIAA